MGGRGDPASFYDPSFYAGMADSIVSRYRFDPNGYDQFLIDHPQVPRFPDDDPRWGILEQMVKNKIRGLPEDTDWDPNTIGYLALGAMVLAVLFLAP